MEGIVSRSGNIQAFIRAGAVPLHPQPGEHRVWVGNMVLQHRQRTITSIADEHVPRGVRQG